MNRRARREKRLRRENKTISFTPVVNWTLLLNCSFSAASVASCLVRFPLRLIDRSRSDLSTSPDRELRRSHHLSPLAPLPGSSLTPSRSSGKQILTSPLPKPKFRKIALPFLITSHTSLIRNTCMTMPNDPAHLTPLPSEPVRFPTPENAVAKHAPRNEPRARLSLGNESGAGACARQEGETKTLEHRE